MGFSRALHTHHQIHKYPRRRLRQLLREPFIGMRPRLDITFGGKFTPRRGFEVVIRVNHLAPTRHLHLAVFLQLANRWIIVTRAQVFPAVALIKLPGGRVGRAGRQTQRSAPQSAQILPGVRFEQGAEPPPAVLRCQIEQIDVAHRLNVRHQAHLYLPNDLLAIPHMNDRSSQCGRLLLHPRDVRLNALAIRAIKTVSRAEAADKSVGSEAYARFKVSI